MSDRLPTPIVSTAWLGAHLGEPDLVVLDASWYLAAMNRDPLAEYDAGHLPGAIFWDLEALSDQGSSLPHMLPDPETLSRQIGALGIGNRDRVVVYDASGINLSAPRIWWTFKIAGHDEVAVLDGGLARWRAEGRPLERGIVPRPPTRFAVRFQDALIKSFQEMQAIVAAGGPQILDARSRGRFEGTEPEPRPGIRGGHMPGSRSLPYAELVDDHGMLLGPDELQRRFRAAGVDLSRPVVVSCGSGVTACALALGLARLGLTQFAVYDGSWTEWGRPDGPPIEQGPPNPR